MPVACPVGAPGRGAWASGPGILLPDRLPVPRRLRSPRSRVHRRRWCRVGRTVAAAAPALGGRKLREVRLYGSIFAPSEAGCCSQLTDLAGDLLVSPRLFPIF